MARKAFKVRLYPNKVQAIYFSKVIGCSRAVYNLMLHDAIASYEEYKKSIEGLSDDEKKKKKYKQRISYAPYTKQENTSYLKEVEARALNSVQQNLKTAFTNFFKGAGFPVYKKKTNLGSFQSDAIKVIGNKLKIPKCPGLVQYKNYEDVDFSKMATKTITISRNVAGKFFASILCDVPDDEPLPKTGKNVGIDLGVSTAVTFDDGRKIDRLSIITDEKVFTGHRDGYDHKVNDIRKQIAFYQQKLAKAGVWTTVTFTGKDGKQHTKRKLVQKTGNYIRLQKKISALTEKLNNKRNDYVTKVAKFVVQDADVICMEDLNILNGMMKDDQEKTNRENGRSHRNIAEASMGMIGEKIKSMAERYGKTVVEVDPRYTTMTCSNCGHVLSEKLPTSVREWTCPICGTHHDRDVNAAKNNKKLGLDKLGEVC